LIITEYFNIDVLKYKRKGFYIPAAYFYLKKPMFNDPRLDNCSIFYVLDSSRISNVFVINPYSIRYFDQYFFSLREQF